MAAITVNAGGSPDDKRKRARCICLSIWGPEKEQRRKGDNRATPSDGIDCSRCRGGQDEIEATTVVALGASTLIQEALESLAAGGMYGSPHTEESRTYLRPSAGSYRLQP